MIIDFTDNEFKTILHCLGHEVGDDIDALAAKISEHVEFRTARMMSRERMKNVNWQALYDGIRADPERKNHMTRTLDAGTSRPAPTLASGETETRKALEAAILDLICDDVLPAYGISSETGRDDAELPSAIRATIEALRSDLSAALARNAEIEAETVERAAIAGWNACRRSIYAACEDVDREAEETYLKASKGGSPTSTEGHLSEFQSGHVSGYRSGMVRAAKSIARGFNSMEAMDDDNLAAAIRSIATKQEKAE